MQLQFNSINFNARKNFSYFMNDRNLNLSNKVNLNNYSKPLVASLHSSSISKVITMTNKKNTNSTLQNNFEPTTNDCLIKKSFHTTNANGSLDPKQNDHVKTPATPSCFRTMASVQKLVTEPTREHIENIRHLLKGINAKNNNEQEITMVKDHDTGIASVCIRSAAKNGISCKMMSDFLDIIDDLYAWNEGKGVIIYGHNGFFCSGKLLQLKTFLSQ